MADPVSWLLLEPGWDVVARGGEKIGAVAEVSGDPNTDIFDGLAVSAGMLGSPRYVPSERVSAIYEGRGGGGGEAGAVGSLPGGDAAISAGRAAAAPPADAFDSLPVWDGSPPGSDALPPGLVDG